ncbi:DNA mismatch repair endonuclease MutL [Thermocoleostomius sinensis]|uniref:DNA mismatch repair endonuclease MutL n=1 Tax=Thermocoleostomius sinensis A174 TaxID=2016057 RepID=A0A9E9C9D2_9CYAN|nr:DNA mismatch repair endonuclease MutL [Thermocoleostomius sinensis]WAL61443.1 DNA mismatch repair endonuclease MutL [Thermocoleostomius sinensis A174]
MASNRQSDQQPSHTTAIQTLPTEVIHLMAAGEVIDSLAAVVRELAENALDAKATRIVVSVWLDQWRVRVVDNGVGIPLDDLHQAAVSHSTSKIRSSQDLWHVHSLGFRGEALHSLAQLADLEICSRCIDADGWHVKYSAEGEVEAIETVAIAPGTVVTVSDLFGHWTARRQTPPPTQQLRLIQSTIHHLALCHPQVTWQVQQGDRNWFSIGSGTTAQQILPQILRDVQPSDLQRVQVPLMQSSNSNAARALDLLMGLPDRCHRHRLDWVKVAINGRMVKCPELEQCIVSAFRHTLPRDRYPLCFVHLQVPPSEIDWNRHPAKAEIYLRSMSDWQQAIVEAIDQALRLGSVTLPDSAYATRVGHLIETADRKVTEGAGQYRASSSKPPKPDTDALSDSLASSLPPASLKAVAQVHNMYILAEHPAGVWLVEQHIAHERVLYEQLCQRWELVALDPPLILHQLSAAQLEQLQRLGISVEPFGEQLWAVRSAPEPLAPRSDCADALLELSLGGNLDAALVATACRTAIRNGTPLSLSDMQDLLDRWQQTRHPRTCPHGRPIYLPLAETSLSRFFRRHWVIGKSHGI